MKKTILLSFLFSLVLSPLAYAATVGPVEVSGLPQSNGTKNLVDLVITAEADGEITAEHGVRFMFEPTLYILWDKSVTELTASGPAVESGKVAASITPEYDHEKGAVYIPILQDLSAGESFTLAGLRMRTYQRNVSKRSLMVDINGDFVKDFDSYFSFYVNESAGSSDNTGPYAPTEVSYTMENGKPVITWVHPLDWDLAQVRIEKYTREGAGTFTPVSYSYDLVPSGDVPSFTDDYYNPDIDNQYRLVPVDIHNRDGEAVEVTILAGQTEEGTTGEEEGEVTEPVEEPEEETSGPQESEVEELTRLLNYYNIRYSIKCKPSGVPVPENDSACLWARIDLIYSQQKTGSEQVRDLALSQRDKDLMQSRRKWSEMRYEDNCVNADEPASYCSALGKALDRVSYFLD